jgi:mannose-1-phosphate guanylyltransferase
MKAVIFAGGAGTRLWPLSRKNFPKQFGKVIGEKSTLQLTVERLHPEFTDKDIIICTNKSYIKIVKKQFPKIPEENIIGEPELRDVGPSVGIVTSLLYKRFKNTPIIILWSDHIVKNTGLFKKIIKAASDLVKTDRKKIIFIGQKPRFASQNLGWIKYGNVKKVQNEIKFHAFSGFHYRPSIDQAGKYLKHGNYTWNLGYFVTTPDNLWQLYKQYQPEIFIGMQKLSKYNNYKDYVDVLDKVYPKFPKISFDNAILELMEKKNAYVVSDDLGWSDIGAWEALKEALQKSPEENVLLGKVMEKDCSDSLVYNYEKKLVVTIDLNGYIVINTPDVILVCHKNSSPKIKNLVEHLSDSENQHLI